jgi:hypothetical protein
MGRPRQQRHDARPSIGKEEAIDQSIAISHNGKNLREFGTPLSPFGGTGRELQTGADGRQDPFGQCRATGEQRTHFIVANFALKTI